MTQRLCAAFMALGCIVRWPNNTAYEAFAASFCCLFPFPVLPFCLGLVPDELAILVQVRKGQEGTKDGIEHL